MANDQIVTDPKLATVLEVSQNARAQAQALADIFAEELASPSPPTGERAFEIAKQQKLLNANLANVRGLHRAALFGARDTKAQTAEYKQEVDKLHLQLQNLYYEQRHLQAEITACESYDHKYQQLPLIPADEFLEQHPELAEADEQALMIARIDHERTERETLEQQRQELLKRKQKLIADNKKRRDDLANLDKDLEKFIDAARPIQKLFEKVV